MAQEIKLAKFDFNLQDAIGESQTAFERVNQLKEAMKDLRSKTKNFTIASSEQNQQYIELNRQLKEAQDNYKEQEKAIKEMKLGVDGLVDSIEKEITTKEQAIKNNKELRDAQKRLNVTTEEGQKANDALNKKIEQNTEFIKGNADAYTQQKMNIGNYTSALEGISPQLANVLNGMQSTTVGAKIMSKAWLAIPIVAIVGAFVGLVSILGQSQSFIDGLNVRLEQAKAIFETVTGGVRNFGEGLVKWFKGEEGAVEQMSGAFENLGEKIKTSVGRAGELEKARQEYRKLSKESSVLQTNLQAESERYQAIADDATRSFAERSAANQKAMKTEERLTVERVKMAAENLRLIKAEADERRRNGKITDELTDEEVEAINMLNEARSESQLKFLDNEKIRRELKSDELERDLDILIDGFDNQKSINERLIADETKTFKERKKILEKTAKEADKSFDKQKDVIQQLTDEKIDFNDLLMTSDATQLNEKIRQLGLSEIWEGRLLESIRERRIVEADLAEVNLDLARQENEAKIELEKTLLEVTKEMEETQFNQEKLDRAERNRQELQDMEDHNRSMWAIAREASKQRERETIANINNELKLKKDAINEEIEERKRGVEKLGLGEEAHQKAILEIVKLGNAEIQLAEDEAEAGRSQAKEQGSEERLQIERDEQQGRLAIIAEKGEQIVQVARDLTSILDSIDSARTSKRRQETIAHYDELIAAAGGNKEEVERLEKEKADALDKIAQEQEGRERERKKRLLYLELALAIAKTASAVASALAMPPFPPLSIPQAVAAGIAGGVQIASIIAQIRELGGSASYSGTGSISGGTGNSFGGQNNIPDSAGGITSDSNVGSSNFGLNGNQQGIGGLIEQGTGIGGAMTGGNFHGTDFVTKNSTARSGGRSDNAGLFWLHEGEAVIPSWKNQKYNGLSKAMLEGNVGNWVMNNREVIGLQHSSPVVNVPRQAAPVVVNKIQRPVDQARDLAYLKEKFGYNG